MIVIGAGRVGQGLQALDPQLRLLTRERGWEALDEPAGEPIFVAVRNDDLSAVLERVPEHRHTDLVFTQNGMLRDFLSERGLANATRGLLFFAVAKRGDRPAPGGTSPFWGPRAEAVASWLRDLDLPADAVDAQSFAAVELEKLIWNCAFGLCCQAFELSVGEVVEERSEELRELVAELHRVGEAAMQVSVDFEALYERLCAYSLSISDYRGAVKEWPWRNGWFVQRAESLGIDTPRHLSLLAEVGR
jgi:ketopantoate reductase